VVRLLLDTLPPKPVAINVPVERTTEYGISAVPCCFKSGDTRARATW